MFGSASLWTSGSCGLGLLAGGFVFEAHFSEH